MTNVVISKNAQRALEEQSGKNTRNKYNVIDAEHVEVQFDDEVIQELEQEARDDENISDVIIRLCRDGREPK